MEFPKSFIRASEAYNTFEHHVPAPYLRRAFQIDHEAKANVIITALGFYELYLNGERITKGRLAPYISNPDDLVYYDTYEVTLRAGENVLGVWPVSYTHLDVYKRQLLESRDEMDRLLSVIHISLSDFELRVLSLYLGGYKRQEAERKLGISARAFDNAMARVRKKLRQKNNDAKG